MSFVCIQFKRHINRTLSGTTTRGQSGIGGDGKEEVLRIPQSDCLVSYLGSYPSAKMQSVYSIAPTNWAGKAGANTFCVWFP